MTEQPATVRPAKCYSCANGEHRNFPHTWGTVDDFEEAALGLAPWPGDCQCECGRIPPEYEAAFRAALAAMLAGAEKRRNQPAKPDDLDEIRRRITADGATRINAAEKERP